MHWRGLIFYLMEYNNIIIWDYSFYFIKSYLSGKNDNFSKEDQIKKIDWSFYFLFLSLWYALIDISKISNPYSIP